VTTAQLQQDEGTAATVGALLDRRVRSLALLLLAASFLSGFAVGKFAVWPLIGWLL